MRDWTKAEHVGWGGERARGRTALERLRDAAERVALADAELGAALDRHDELVRDAARCGIPHDRLDGELTARARAALEECGDPEVLALVEACAAATARDLE